MCRILPCIALFLIGCAPIGDVALADRTRLYDADHRTVFESTIDYLTDKGFRFDVFDIDRGIIRTAPTPTNELNTRSLPGRYITTIELNLDERSNGTVVTASAFFDIDLGREIKSAGLSYHYKLFFYDRIFKGIAAYSL